MRKLNNKGFAITTLLYGLLSVVYLIMTLLMGIMSTNRQNTSTLVDRIEEELNRYGETETTFAYIGEMQEYVVPYGQSGWYKIELWGAKTNKGNGSYTSGLVYLEESQSLYFYLGNSCNNATKCATAFNAGNTEVRTTPTGLKNWNDATSIRSTIMRAGGGTNDSYVSGMSGMNSVNRNGDLTYQTNHYSGKIFLNGLFMEGANSGQGMANIELVYSANARIPPPKKTDVLDSVRYIRSCTAGNSVDSYNYITELQAIELATGKNLAKKRVPSPLEATTDGDFEITPPDHGPNDICVTIDLGRVYELSEIGIWNNYSDDRYYYHHTVSVSKNGASYTYLKKDNYRTTNVTTSVRESKVGHRYTAWQPDTTTVLPTGNYYIVSTYSPNKVLTAQDSRDVTNSNGANVTTEVFKASKLQKWTIEAVDINSTYVANKSTYDGKTVYKIYESENKNALQIQNGNAGEGENACAKKPYRAYEWDLWYIEPLGNGTYKIKSLLGTYLSTSSDGSSPMNVVLKSHISDSKNFSQRWKVINAEY